LTPFPYLQWLLQWLHGKVRPRESNHCLVSAKLINTNRLLHDSMLTSSEVICCDNSTTYVIRSSNRLHECPDTRHREFGDDLVDGSVDDPASSVLEFDLSERNF
jgi:hypothetical protein